MNVLHYNKVGLGLYSNLPRGRRFLSVSSNKCVRLTFSNNKSLSEEDYQVLHRSNVPTMHFQKSLLRLPIPELDKTCSRYLRSQKAILSASEYAETQKVVQDFGNGGGKQLQEQLKAIDKANKHTSYISSPWFDMYLSDRVPIVLNYNPFLAFLPEEREGYAHPVVRATNILVSSMRFLNTLKQGILKPEVYHLNPSKSDTPTFRKVIRWMPTALASYAAYAFKAFPLDMSQFKNLFHSTRIPQRGKDVIRHFPEDKHMLVLCRGNYYVFDIYDENGNLHNPAHIHALLSYIYNDNPPPLAAPVGVLTAQNRDDWADLRKELILAGNEATLRAIDGAAFNLVFDDVITERSPEKCYRTFLYGDPANRWFDKSFSLLFTKDGETALNFEHSWGDGVAVMRYFNEVYKEVMDHPWVGPGSSPAPIDASAHVRRLEWKLSPKLCDAIQKALRSYEEQTKALKVDIYDEPSVLGKALCKKHKLSPDAVMQLGFQVGYFLQNGHTVATYESCSTSAFRHGRTETLRPATLETTAFSKAAATYLGGARTGGPSKKELKELLYDCSKMHGQLTKEAAMGQGFDRHLFGLRKIAEGSGRPLPPMFTDPSYAKMNHNIVSTSTLPSTLISFGGFGPVVRDGFGVGYQIQEDRLGIVLSSYPPHRDGPGFIECASKAYKLIRDLLQTDT